MKQRIICFSDLCLLGDPRFFTFDGQDWALDEVALNQWDCALANAGATMKRLMPWSVWLPHPHGMKSQFSPYVLQGDKFDLGKFNDYYFKITRRIIEIAKKYGITTTWCLADNCQFHGKDKKWSPWVANINGINSIYDPPARIYFKKFIERCKYEFGPLRVLWSWGNEMDNILFVDLARDTIYPMLKSQALNAINCTYGATMRSAAYDNGTYTPDFHTAQEQLKKDVGATFGDDIKLAIWREVHGVGGNGYPSQPNALHQALTWWARIRNNGIRIWLSDDGVWDGDSPCDVTIYEGKEQRRPSAERWAQIIAIAKGFANDFVFEHLPKGGGENCQVNTIKAMYKALNGHDPTTRYYYDPEPPEPPEPVPPLPPPEPEPPKKVSWWRYLLHWLFGEHSWWHGWWQ
jgi:hypothetical protein